MGTDRLLGTAGADAIALDDSFSAFPGSRGARLAEVEVIDVGDGHDIVDLTSMIYTYGDVTLIGGNGDDTLWANSGQDILLGGSGNDNLYMAVSGTTNWLGMTGMTRSMVVPGPISLRAVWATTIMLSTM